MYVESTEYYCNYYGGSEIGFWCDLFCLLWGLAGWSRFLMGMMWVIATTAINNTCGSGVSENWPCNSKICNSSMDKPPCFTISHCQSTIFPSFPCLNHSLSGSGRSYRSWSEQLWRVLPTPKHGSGRPVWILFGDFTLFYCISPNKKYKNRRAKHTAIFLGDPKLADWIEYGYRII